MARGLQVGETVGWHHRLSASVETVLRSKLPADLDASGPTPVGTITGIGNDAGTHFHVEFENGETRTLTAEELVRVVED